ncbi:hypothetical protein B0H13DRAFT_1855107 [Mycena leptocephala]|nr:hypothetical protein B0H13DRAFT_1855107 [Mycena leptocephala]
MPPETLDRRRGRGKITTKRSKGQRVRLISAEEMQTPATSRWCIPGTRKTKRPPLRLADCRAIPGAFKKTMDVSSGKNNNGEGRKNEVGKQVRKETKKKEERTSIRTNEL